MTNDDKDQKQQFNVAQEDSAAKKNKFAHVYEDSKNVLIPLIIGIVLSLIILGLGITVSVKTASPVGKIITVFGAFSALAFAFTIFACFKYRSLVDGYIQDYESNHFDNKKFEDLDQSTERTLLNIALYMLMLIFLVFLILSIGCFAFQGQIRSEVNALSKNPVKWQEYFGSYTYEQILGKLTSICVVLGIFSILLAFFIGVLLFFAFKILGTYRTWQTIVEFVCIIFFQLGLVFLYLAVYAEKYKAVANVEKAMPQWVPDALLATAAIALVISVFGYLGAWLEKGDWLKIFCIATGLFTVLIIIFAIGAALYSSKFEKYFDSKCSVILDYINQDYLNKYIGCDKYAFNSTRLDGMQCPKERVVTAWEINVGKNLEDQKDLYGCINQSCCYQTYNWIKSNLDYLVLIGFSLFFFGALMVGGSYYMLTLLAHKEEEGETENKAQYCAGIVVACLLICIIVLISMIPNPPIPSPTTAAVVEPAPPSSMNISKDIILVPNITKVTENDTAKNLINAKNNTAVSEDKTICGAGCLKLKYFYDISSQDGVFTLNKTALDLSKATVTKNEKKGTGWIIEMTGDASDLESFTQYFNFVHNCPLNPSSIHVTVLATAYNPANPAPTSAPTGPVQVFTTDPTTGAQAEKTIQPGDLKTTIYTPSIDLSKLNDGKSYGILSKDLDFSFVSSSYQLLTGSVFKVVDLKTGIPIPDATVKVIPMDFAQCPITTYTTKADGSFTSEKLYVLQNNIPTQYKVEITATGLTSFKKKFTVGGLGWTQVINLGSIGLWDPLMIKKATIKSVVLNSINNSQLPGVTVSLYAGYKDVANAAEETVPVPTQSFLQISSDPASSTTTTTTPTTSNDKNPLLKTAQTGDDGQFIFPDLDPNTYTLILEKPGFFREVRCKLH